MQSPGVGFNANLLLLLEGQYRCRFSHTSLFTSAKWCKSACRRLEQLLKRYNRGEIARVEWLDHLTLSRIQQCRAQVHSYGFCIQVTAHVCIAEHFLHDTLDPINDLSAHCIVAFVPLSVY